MEKLKQVMVRERLQITVFGGISLGVAVVTLLLTLIDATPFHRFIGDLNPLGGVMITGIAGFFGLIYLISGTQLAVYKKHRARDYLIISGIALIFGLEVIAADLWLVDYGADINTAFPKSLLFYPAIGYGAEMVFHVLPLALFVFILSRCKKLDIDRIVWISIIAVMLIEPLFQAWFVLPDSITTAVYTGLHVLLFSAAQLLIFKRYDFVSMYLMRLIFYAIWHIAWGYMRLQLIF